MCRADVHMCTPMLVEACCDKHMGTSAFNCCAKPLVRHLAYGGYQQLAESHGCCS
jgi:hypothetical protein